jgi:tungstate transport system substrate-binding protein
MSNRFVIVGPQADPAGVRGMTDASKALREIARQRATFVSRGDNSGT